MVERVSEHDGTLFHRLLSILARERLRRVRHTNGRNTEARDRRVGRSIEPRLAALPLLNKNEIVHRARSKHEIPIGFSSLPYFVISVLAVDVPGGIICSLAFKARYICGAIR